MLFELAKQAFWVYNIYILNVKGFTMKMLTIDSFSSLVRTGSVHRVFITPYPSIDGGGWFLDVDHSDNGQSRQLHTKREGLRLFKNSDTAISTLRDCGYVGPVAVVMLAP